MLSLSTVLIAAWRWHRLLTIFDIFIPQTSLTCIVPIAQFFSLFLPGSSGDDLTRMLYLSRLAPGRGGEACATVVLDRLIGLTSVVLLGSFGVPWQWALLSTTRETHWLGIAIMAVAALVCAAAVIFLIGGRPTHRWFERRLRSRPAHSLRDEAARIWGLLCNNKRVVGKLLTAALVAQLIQCVSFYLAGVAVGIDRPFSVWMTFLPIVFAAQALPITVAGVGIREYLLILFLSVVAGVERERAFAASFAMFAIMLSVSFVGGVLYIFYRPRAKSTSGSPEASELSATFRPL